jgi:hypothetical protein
MTDCGNKKVTTKYTKRNKETMERRMRNNQTKEEDEGYYALLGSVQGYRSHGSLADRPVCYEILGFCGGETVGVLQDNPFFVMIT